MDLYHTLQSNKPDEDIFQRPICLAQFLIIFFCYYQMIPTQEKNNTAKHKLICEINFFLRLYSKLTFPLMNMSNSSINSQAILVTSVSVRRFSFQYFLYKYFFFQYAEMYGNKMSSVLIMDNS
jgi:hypothetical protein